MMRIRRKFALILCGCVLTLFIFLYLLINYSIPTDRQHNLHNIETKLKQLENGLNQHNEVMGELKKRIDTINNLDKINYDDKPAENQIVLPNPSLNKQDMIKEMIINAENNYQNCPFIIDSSPQPDIQMLNLYKEIPFDNLDGGPWKQGWRIQYDPLQFNKHHKLKVFVVPHSHNDPGWIKTFDEYYEHDTKHILSNMLRHLTENPSMTFIWAEIVFFSRWFDSLSESSVNSIKKLIKNKQLEFVTGGWVMTDEANSHWLSILLQLTEGTTWLKNNLNYTPTASWAIDPFGHSSTMPYLLKNSGIENLLIQRTHYSVKKRLAQKKELEFLWRQIWDGSGKTELLTHMMPFYSYDVPHTCGPDPKVCCQFDFKRLPGFGLTCPWRIAPQEIDDLNVAKKAELIVDQWRKKSTLYRSRSVLIPLGDDFRFSQSTEWESQRRNYEKLFDYINNEPNLFTEAKFSTLQEYFNSLRHEKKLNDFPSLSGDFFTYADRDDHYWSGYYTSRPYHKRMDRILLHYIRSAEILHSWNKWDPSSELSDLLTNAKRQLSLFQHHDGITGTAKNHVVRDYAQRLLEAVKACKFVMQQATYRLLTKPSVYVPDYKFNYFHLDDSRWPGPDDSRTTIILGDELPIKYVVFHNSLPQWREELIDLYVSKPYVKVTDFNQNLVESQITPVWSWQKGYVSITTPQFSTTKYQLMFKVRVPPLGLSTYIIHSTNTEDTNTGTNFAKVTILTTLPFTINVGDYPTKVEFAKPRDISLKIGNGPIAAFNSFGLLKSISIGEKSPHIPVHLEFLKYGVRRHGGMSGAYLFLPDGPAIPLMIGASTVLVCQGKFESTISTGLPFATHQTILRGGAIEIKNLIDINNMDNTEIVMRLSTNIDNKDIFYTDLNGFQTIKRQRLPKIPLQANYYPIPSKIFIEDEKMRLTLLSGQPLGGSSLKSGEIEIMQDRRLAHDDERGLGQGVLDNQPVLHVFRVILEDLKSCKNLPSDYPAGFLTVNAHHELQTLLYPLDKFVWNENDWAGALGIFGNEHEPFESDFELGAMKTVPSNASKNKDKLNTGLVIFRPHLCDSRRSGFINIKHLLNLENDYEIYSSTLTLLKKDKQIITEDIMFCPMDIKAFIVQR